MTDLQIVGVVTLVWCNIEALIALACLIKQCQAEREK